MIVGHLTYESGRFFKHAKDTRNGVKSILFSGTKGLTLALLAHHARGTLQTKLTQAVPQVIIISRDKDTTCAP